MRSAKSIDRIYDEVRDCDIVITNDAPLATALNARIETACIGSFAYTPRLIAAMESVRILGTGVMGDLRIISEIANETGLDFKYIHGELENIRRIRRYRKDVEDFLYTKNAKEVYESFRALPTIEKIMGNYDPAHSPFFEGKKVAVVGVDLFDDLDKHFVPLDFKDVDIFGDDEFHIERMYQIGNDRQIADNVVDLIDRAAANDTAIVMDTEGPVADAIRAALYRKKMPFKNNLSVKDLSQVRDYLQFVRLALSYDTVRVKHVREIFSNYGGYLDSRMDEYLLSRQMDRIDNKHSSRLAQIMKDIRGMTFGEALEEVVHKMSRPQIKILLDDLRLTDSKISTANVNKMVYAVENVSDLHHNEQIPEDERKGVLLVNCNNSTFIDRPFVIFVGLGPEWSPKIIGKNYIDRVTEAERNIAKFSVLIQQGTSRVYAVNTMRGGKPAKPCTFFEALLEKPATQFEEVCTETQYGPWTSEVPQQFSGKGVSPLSNEPVDGVMFTKSTYKKFRTCPRAYMLGEVIRTPDSEYTVLGSIIHEFAELYLCYPEIVRSKGVMYYVDLIQDRHSGISCEQMKSVDMSSIAVSMHNIMRLIDSMGIGKPELDRRNSDRKYPNQIMKAEGLDMCSAMTEVSLTSKTAPMFGNFDLLSGTQIVDYKTGRQHSAEEIRSWMLEGSIRPEFQPIMYLALLSEHLSGSSCRFKQFYVRNQPVKSVTTPGFDIEENTRTVEYIDRNLEDYLGSPDCFLKASIANSQKNYAAAWEKSIAVMLEYPRDEWPTSDAMFRAMVGAIGLNDNATNIGNAKGFAKKIFESTHGRMFCVNGKVKIPRDTMAAFIDRLCSDQKAAAKMTSSDFPADPVQGYDCRKCDFFKACTRDKIVIEEAMEDE